MTHIELLGPIISLAVLLLSSVCAFFIANALCQRYWKEKIPQSKLIGFTVVFVGCFSLLFYLMIMAVRIDLGN